VSESRIRELRTLLSLDAFVHGSYSEWHLYILHRNCCVIVVKFSPDAPVRLDCFTRRSKIAIIEFLHTIHHLVFNLKRVVSENGFCLHPQVKPSQMDPIDRASPYLWTKDNVRKLSHCNNMSSSQTFRS
jgi:hypothetical protein